DPARVTFVELPFNQVADALKSGRIDAGTAAPPFSYRIATSIGRTLHNVDEMLPPGSLTGTLVATRAWANGNKDAINKYREAIEEGMAFIAKNDAEAREILARYTNVAPEVYANVPFPVFAVRVVPKQLDAYVDMALEQKLIKTKIDPAKLVFP